MHAILLARLVFDMQQVQNGRATLSASGVRGRHSTMLPSIQPMSAQLDRTRWHRPLISVIITHYNYSNQLEESVLSVLDQTHQNFELVVVDDASSPEHLDRAREIVSRHGANVRLLELPENVGQIAAFFAGLDSTSGQFVCALDPDDRYAPTFLEEAVGAHLGVMMCPMVSTDQFLLTPQGLVSGGYHHLRRMAWTSIGNAYVTSDLQTHTYYFSPHAGGWNWCTTSALMYRRIALDFLRPHKPFPLKRALDAYLAQGCHYMGGTLFYAKPLVYRMLHENNSWISNRLFSSFQDTKREEVVSTSDIALTLAKEALYHNGAPVDEIRSRAPNPASKRKDPLSRLLRSIRKRLPAATILAPQELSASKKRKRKDPVSSESKRTSA